MEYTEIEIEMERETERSGLETLNLDWLALLCFAGLLPRLDWLTSRPG